MGGTTFGHVSKGKTAAKAFAAAVKEAQYDFGHAGYTGTIAEKDEFTLLAPPNDEKAEDFANRLIHEGDERIDDKWGPAGCVEVKKGEFYFFGWASC